MLKLDKIKMTKNKRVQPTVAIFTMANQLNHSF